MGIAVCSDSDYYSEIDVAIAMRYSSGAGQRGGGCL